MRLVYLLHLNYSGESGVSKKVAQQISEWAKAGHRVTVAMATNRRSNPDEIRRHLGNVPIRAEIYEPGMSIKGALSRTRAIEKCCKGVLQASPDLVYMRQDMYYPALRQLAKRLPLIMEINTDDLQELRSTAKLRFLYHACTRRLMLGSISGAVFVTEEIRRRPYFRLGRTPSITIPNGFPLSYVSPPEGKHELDRSFVFVGTNNMPWHGVDKISYLAERAPEWQFKLIGGHRHFKPPNMQCLGELDRKALDIQLRKACVGLGTLALHRNGMDEACPLKTREYLAYGLPVVIGYKDADFPAGAEFLCEIGNSEDNVVRNVEKILQFAESWSNRRVKRSEIAHLSTEQKEAERLAFFREVFRNRS